MESKKGIFMSFLNKDITYGLIIHRLCRSFSPKCRGLRQPGGFGGVICVLRGEKGGGFWVVFYN